MRNRITTGIALFALTLGGCCPGSMLGGNAIPPAPPAHVARVAPKPIARPALAPDSDGDGVADNLDRCPGTPKGCTVDAWGCILDQDGDGICDAHDKCPDTPRGVSMDSDGCSAAQLAAKNASAPRPVTPPSPAEKELTERGSIRLENVYFESNSARLGSQSSRSLDEAGAALEKFPALKLEVEGHTDSRGATAYNRRLSQARAEAVRRYLLDHFQLSPGQLTAKGYGSSQPETRGRSAKDLKQERRVVLRVLNRDVLPKHVEIKR